MPGASEYGVWNTDANGNYTSNVTGVLSGASYALENLELSFGEDLNGDGTIGPTTATIATNGTTNLTQVANQYELNPAGGGAGPFAEYSGSAVTVDEFGGWTPIGAEKTASGYEVAWSMPGADEYAVWNTDASGNYTSHATGVLSGASYALENLELSFGEDLNGDGTIGPTTATIATNGATTLAQVANQYELETASGGAGPFVSYGGSAVTVGELGGWTPVGAEKTASGYEVAWSVHGANEYAVWNTDANGNYTSSATGVLSGQSFALEDLEPAFGEDLNGDGRLSTVLVTSTIAGNNLDLSGQTQAATINLGANGANAPSSECSEPDL